MYVKVKQSRPPGIGPPIPQFAAFWAQEQLIVYFQMIVYKTGVARYIIFRVDVTSTPCAEVGGLGVPPI